MGVIKQLKLFITGTKVFPITKTNAVYDDKMGRLDNILHSTLVEDDDILEDVGDTPRDADTLGGHLPSYFLDGTEKDANVSGSLASHIKSVQSDVSTVKGQIESVEEEVDTLATQVSSFSGQIDTIEGQIETVENEVDSLSTQVGGFDSRINEKADKSVTFTEATTLTNLSSGETLPTLFGKISKGITDFISHISQNATASVFGHVKLSDTYASAVQNNKAKDGLGASQYALYSAYNSLTTDSSVTMKAKGNKSTATLDFLDIGTFRIAGLTNTNSPSGTDTDGILINASAMNLTTTAMSATFQIFFGKTSQTVYARLQMGDSWTNAWVKLSA